MTVSFNKPRQRWVYDFERGGKRYQGYCVDATGQPVTSKSGATQAEGVEKRRVDMAPKIARPGEMTVAMAAAALTGGWKIQASWSMRVPRIKDVLAFFGPETPIAGIDQARVNDYVVHCQTTPIQRWTGGPDRDPLEPKNARYWVAAGKTRAIATVTLYLSTLAQILARAAAHRDPMTGELVFKNVPKVPRLRRQKRKARPMPSQVSAEIMSIMPAHVIDAMVLTDCFGFRRGEVFSLERTQVDWEACGIRLHAEDVKDDEDAFLPVSQFAIGYLWCLDMDAEARDVRHLITFRRRRAGKVEFVPIKKPRSAWTRARNMMLAKYGRTWRWHDIRAAYISHVALTSGGVVAGKMARHSDPETTQAYIDVADEFQRIAADRASHRAQMIGANESPLHDPLTRRFAAAQGQRKLLK